MNEIQVQDSSRSNLLCKAFPYCINGSCKASLEDVRSLAEGGERDVLSNPKESVVNHQMDGKASCKTTDGWTTVSRKKPRKKVFK